MPRTVQLKWATYFVDPRAQVAVSRAPWHGDVKEHHHNFIEIAIVLSGYGAHVTEGIRQHVQSGDVLVIHSSQSHAYENTCDLNIINILIREEVFRETEKELGKLPGYHALFTLRSVGGRQRGFTSHFRLHSADLRLATLWIDALEEETRKKSEGGLLLARSWLILLIGMLARQYDKTTADHSRLEMRLGRVLSRMDQDAAEKFTLAELAGYAAMSERTFLRHFRKATGYSPMDYMIRNRIRRAAALLGGGAPGPSITEIAFRCGFQDSNYFSRQFRRATGTTPRGYRNAVKSEKVLEKPNLNRR